MPFSIEKLFEDYALIISQVKVLVSDERWEKFEMFGKYLLWPGWPTRKITWFEIW